MSDSEHRAGEPTGVRARVVVVSSSRTEKTDRSGRWIAESLTGAGHQVLSVTLVADDADDIESEVLRAAADGQSQVIILTGGTGVTATDVTPEAVYPLLQRDLPGFGEIFRALSFEEIGPAAMWSRAFAGVAGPLAVFALPGSLAAVKLAMERLILPDLGHLCAMVARDGYEAVIAPEVEDDATYEDHLDDDFDDESYLIHDEDTFDGKPDEEESFMIEQDDAQAVRGTDIEVSPPAEAIRPTAAEGPWQRWIANNGGFVTHHKRYDVPDVLESIAPFMQVLHTAGSQAVLTLPNGRKYSLWGFPDLARPNAKVLAVGWGKPWGELIALHRYPTPTATCMEGSTGQAPSRSSDVSAICEAVTGAVPKNTTGTLFAVTASEVWIERDDGVWRWDGRKLTDEGFTKQVLASLALSWSNR